MNYYLEIFISNYIKSYRKERLKFEANCEKKKLDLINHFCHETKKYVDEKKIIFYGKLSDCVHIMKEHEKESFFVISNIYIDGKMMNFDELVTYFKIEYMAVIAISNSIVMIKEENECGLNIYILKAHD